MDTTHELALDVVVFDSHELKTRIQNSASHTSLVTAVVVVVVVVAVIQNAVVHVGLLVLVGVGGGGGCGGGGGGCGGSSGGAGGGVTSGATSSRCGDNVTQPDSVSEARVVRWTVAGYGREVGEAAAAASGQCAR